MSTEFVPSGAAALAVEESGQGTPIVFLHAGIADRRSWHWLIEELDLPIRAIRYDRRAFGGTVFEFEEFSHLEDLRTVLDARAVDRAILVGNSQGGRIAIDFALRHPERVRALVLIGSALSGSVGPAHPVPEVARLADAIHQAEADNDGDLLNDLVLHMWLDGPLSAAGRVQGAARDLASEMHVSHLLAVEPGDAEEPPSAVELLSSISVPTLVIVGDLDLPHIVERSEQIAAAIAGAHLVVMCGVAHIPQLEAPAEVASLLRAFLVDEKLIVAHT